MERHRLRSKKMAVLRAYLARRAARLRLAFAGSEKWSGSAHGRSAIFPLQPTPTLLAGLGGRGARPGDLPRTAAAPRRRRPGPAGHGRGRSPLARRAVPDTPIWSLVRPHTQRPASRFKRGDELDISSTTICRCRWRSTGTASTASRRAEPLLARPAVAAGAKDTLRRCRCATPAPSCATSGCSATARRGRHRPARSIVEESEPVAGRPRRGAADRGLAAAPGRHRDRARQRSQGHGAVYTVNGRPPLDIPAARQ